MRKRKVEALTECEMNWINWVQIDVILDVEGELIGIDLSLTGDARCWWC
jgi:hypothetical protein